VRRTFASLSLLHLTFLLCFAGTASGAYIDASSIIRVEALSHSPDINTYKLGPLELEPQRGDTILSYDPVTGVVFYVRQNPWTHFDPHGLWEVGIEIGDHYWGYSTLDGFENYDTVDSEGNHFSPSPNVGISIRNEWAKENLDTFTENPVGWTKSFTLGTDDVPRAQESGEIFATGVAVMSLKNGATRPGSVGNQPRLVTTNGVVVPVAAPATSGSVVNPSLMPISLNNKNAQGADPTDGAKQRQQQQRTTNQNDSSKNEKHGDGGRALSKAEQQIKQYEEQLKTATGRLAKKIQQKMQNVIKDANRKKKGEEHSRTKKG
jgi:hypothetical protein